jgi:glutamate N-acetyltransferase/amino-acid N-acetyltransferase
MGAVNYTSPFASHFPKIDDIQGVTVHTAHTGMRYSKNDLLFVEFSPNTQVAGIFTKNTVCGEPVTWCKAILPNKIARALVVNSGYANVFCGERGRTTIQRTVDFVANKMGCEKNQIYIGSTGVIGMPVNDELLINALDFKLVPANYEQATIAINTTDTFPKGYVTKVTIDGRVVTIAGIIKGSGMIAPNMATMLGYVFTDAAVSADVLQNILNEIKDETYNAITVDSDTSTSDTVLAFATGEAKNTYITDENSSGYAEFRKAFTEVNLELAKLVVKDGEGITKFITVEVSGAESDESAKKMAMSVANSPLVKTAMAGGDANWGRIAMAFGKTGEPVNMEKIDILLGDVECAINGGLSANYDEVKASNYMKGAEITIKVNVHVGSGKATVYTCDLTHEYISINADYRS